MNKFKLAAVASAFALSTFSMSASADIMQLNSVTGANTTIDYTGAPDLPQTVTAGQFNMTNTTTGVDFYAFCVDIFNNLQSPHDYTFGDISNAGWTSLQSGRVNYLFDFYGNILGASATPTVGAAFQIALWEILNETAGRPLDTSTYAFTASGHSTAVSNLVRGMLENVTANATDGYESTIYNLSFASGNPVATVGMSAYRIPVNSQSLITWTPCGDNGCSNGGGDPSGVGEVPEPAPLSLLGIGLLGMLFKRKFN